MELDLTNTEFKYLLTILEKELSEIGKEIHRTDALVYKRELAEKETVLNNIISKLRILEV